MRRQGGEIAGNWGSSSSKRQYLAPNLIGRDLALDPGALLGWVFRDWNGELQDDAASHDGVAPYTLVRPGVALLQFSGPLMLQESWWSDGPTYAMIEEAITDALADLAVGAVVVQLEGPGGLTDGLLNTCARIRRIVAARGIPVFVHSQGQCLSAHGFLAQSLAGAGGLLTAEPTAWVGQLGVYRVLTFIRAALEREGIDVRYVAAGGRKIDLFPEQPPDDAALQRVQGQVTRIYETLCRDAGIGLASRRGLSPEEGYALIRAQDSMTYMGEQEAIDAGAIDRVALLDEVLDWAAAAA